MLIRRKNILQLKYLYNRSYTKNMIIKVNKLKLIWNNVKRYINVIKQKQISG